MVTARVHFLRLASSPRGTGYALSRNSLLFVCAPLRYAQAYGVRKGLVPSVPSTYETACAQGTRTCRLDVLGYSHSSPAGDWNLGTLTSPHHLSFWFTQPFWQGWLGLIHVFTQNEPLSPAVSPCDLLRSAYSTANAFNPISVDQ
jgi:hypothetical protein